MPLALTIKKIEGKPGQVYYPLQLNEVPKPSPGAKQLLVRLKAASLNHRDLFIRQHLYPGISFEHPLLADGYGIVEAAGPGCSSDLVNKAVLLTPMRGWEADPAGPEVLSAYTILGSSVLDDAGTAQDYVVVPEDEVVRAPVHLTPAEAASLPLVGLTAWRAFATKSAAARPGTNILITGIGGGVALQALQFAVATGCNVFVTSSDDAKIARAVADLGARAGVSYRAPDWDRQLAKLLPADRPYLDAVIDGAGGDVVARTVRLLKPGGVVACYGMTAGPKMDWLMQAVLKNVELRGCTMGSKAEFRAMVDFVGAHGIRPVVSRVVQGLRDLAAIDGLFEDMKAGRQFGKLAVLIGDDEGGEGTEDGDAASSSSSSPKL